MCPLVCDRTPKQKSKEEPDREARPGLQAEVDEGDEKVITKSLLLNFILMFPFGWEKWCGQGPGFKSSPTYLWGDSGQIPSSLSWGLVMTAGQCLLRSECSVVCLPITVKRP